MANALVVKNIVRKSFAPARRAVWLATKPARYKKFRQHIADGLPPIVIPAVKFLIDGTLERNICSISDTIEQLRANIAVRGNESVEILYSPRPLAKETEVGAEARPQHGEVMAFSMEQIAQTGKNRRWGTVLHLIARASEAQVILELGTCAGISACYLATSPHCSVMHTVEGSLVLSSIARENITQVVSNCEVHNALFDDALDTLLPELSQIDLAFIDGHHEKVATIHYFQRILPKLRSGSIVIFDDISWSKDMRDCWDFLSAQPIFSHVIDFGAIGICIWDGGDRAPRYWDLQPIVGKTKIGKPHGWR